MTAYPPDPAAASLRVLILEDRPADVELLVHALRHAGIAPDWQRVDTRAEFLTHLEPLPDLILADYTLPQFTGLEALRVLHERGLRIPFVMVSGAAGQESAVTALQAGADDYLLKDHLARLGQTVRRALDQHRLREEQWRAEHALHNSERRFRALIEHSADAIAVLDSNAIVQYAGPSTAGVLGYTSEELVGLNVFELMHPEDVPRIAGLFGQLLTMPGGSLSSEFRSRHKDGTWRWVEGTGTNLLHEPAVQGIVANYRDVTQRKEAQGALRSSRDQLSVILGAIADGVIVLDASRQLVYANPTAARLLGFGSVDDLLATPRRQIFERFDVFDETGQPLAEEQLPSQLALRGLPAGPTTVRFRVRATGEERWSSIRAAPIHDEHGSPHLAVSIFHDETHVYRANAEIRALNANLELRVAEATAELEATVRDLQTQVRERKRAEQSLRGSEQRLRAIMDSASDAIVVADNRGAITDWNRAAEAIFGYPRAEIVGQQLTRLMPKRYRADHAAGLQRFATTGQSRLLGQRVELVGLRADGTEFPHELALASWTQGDERFVTGFVRDITERKRSDAERTQLLAREQASRADAERLAQARLVHEVAAFNLVDGLAIMDCEDRVVLWNPRMAELYGVPPEEAVGRSFWELSDGFYQRTPDPAETRRRSREARATAAAGATDMFEYQLNGDPPRDLVVLVFPIRGPDGTSLGHGRLVRDVTRERAADRLRDEFVSTVSHELRTPMNGVLGMTELLLRTELSPRQQEYAEGIYRSGESLLAIINDILDLSKLEAGRLELEAIPFGVHDIVDDVLELVAPGVHRKALELAGVVDPAVPKALVGDPTRLRQVLLNLVGNAIKFTERGEVVVRAAVAEDSPSQVLVRFDVADTGIGIAPEAQARLFQPFSQLDNSTTRQHGGTGLGLNISKRLVELMGGEIGVDSTPGQGSTFWFTVRCPVAPVTVGRPQVPLLLPPHLRVLVVDDNATNRLILEEELAGWGMEVGSAANGRRALAVLRAASERAAPYDVALLDLQMPGMDGLDLARAIKAEPALAKTLLLLLTSGPDVGRRKADAAGIVSVLAKPVRPSRLLETLVRVTTEVEPATSSSGAAAHGGRKRPGARGRRGQPRAGRRARVGPRVLVVEDAPTNQQLALLSLESLGYQAELADNSQAALDACEHTPYAAILMDVELPGLDGYATTAAIRRREDPARHTPIIALTAHAMPGSRERCLAAGMDDYLAKPVHLEELERVLRQWAPYVETPREPEGAPTTGQNSSPTAQTGGDQAAASGESGVPENTPPLDLVALDRVRRLQLPGQPDVAAQFGTVFLEDSPAQLAAVQAALTHQDATALRQAAHTVKGSAAAIGAHELCDLCEQLEHRGRDGSLEGAAELGQALEDAYQRVRTAVEMLWIQGGARCES